MVIDILAFNIDTIIPIKHIATVPVDRATIPKLNFDTDNLSKIDFSFSTTIPADDAQASLKKWEQFIREKQQESIDEEGCGAVMCEYNLFLWELSDAFYEAHENAAK